MLGHAGFGGSSEAERKPRRQLLGLREIGFGAGTQRSARQRRDPLVGRAALALVDQDREIPLAHLVERIGFGQAVSIETGIGADLGGLALGLRRIVIGRDHAPLDCTCSDSFQRSLTVCPISAVSNAISATRASTWGG